jgi:hypothetical protein
MTGLSLEFSSSFDIPLEHGMFRHKLFALVWCIGRNMDMDTGVWSKGRSVLL